MAEIAIWPGSSSFGLVSDPTPFGFYDYDEAFREDSDKVAHWCVQRLGYPLVDIELQDINLYSCFEEAVNEYGAQVYNATIIYNFGSLVATSTGSSLNNIVVDSNYGAVPYGVGSVGGMDNAGGSGVRGRTFSGSIDIKQGQQWYDMYDPATSNSTVATLEDDEGNFVATSGSITITKIYHEAPAAINRYFDPYAGTGTGIQSLMQSFGFGNYSPGVNFMLMPLYFDVLKLQAIEFNDQIRKSGYHFELENGRYLKIWPIPTSDYKLWYDYKNSYDPLTGNSLSQDTDNDGNSKPTDLITDLSNAPYKAPVYSFINEPGKQWIRKYTLALAKEMLGSVRGKYQTVPIPGAETTLDHSRLLTEAVAEKADLVEKLRTDLEMTSKEKVLERETKEKDNKRAGAANDPMFIYIG
ncbi:putative head completion [uncultured virus]|uniref:Putative head completion n=1 Tax=uncultured virus TaxID=340016 RepID=A0A218ML74_9VIRU|nr:putative head completion [uncultured virus]|tara:strand:- start:773 stop:2005 length:1233 start_codon:yes stop_codon:yes gene_type:complete